MPEWNKSWVDHSWRGEPNTPTNESGVDQSWELNAPKTQAFTQSNQSTSYIEEDGYEDGTNGDGTNRDELYDMQDWSYSNQPPSYNQVHRPETLWQPYYMERYQNELETVDELEDLGKF